MRGGSGVKWGASKSERMGFGLKMDKCAMTEGCRLKTPFNYATVNCPPQLNIV